MKRLFFLCLLVAIAGTLRAAESPPVKWHPGHYIFIGKSDLTKKLLTLPHFRGVQKVYPCRDFESAKGVYDFSTLTVDLALANKHDRQLVVQFSYKKFFVKGRSVPDYLTGDEYGGGVYGESDLVIWNTHVIARFEATLAAFGKAFDHDSNLEAVNLPETALCSPGQLAKLATSPPKGIEPYNEKACLAALKRQVFALRHAFLNTVPNRTAHAPHFHC